MWFLLGGREKTGASVASEAVECQAKTEAKLVRAHTSCRQNLMPEKWMHSDLNGFDHGLRTPNEGINHRNLKIWADVADKICFGRT